MKDKITKLNKRLCDAKCNECLLISNNNNNNNNNNRQLTKILNILYDKFGEEAYKIIQDNCPNLTCCVDCRIDDFCHIKGCKICENIDLEKKQDV